jgi:hypothetical protein
VLTAYIATIISLTITPQDTWFNDRFYGVGFIQNYRAVSTISDHSGFSSPEEWTSAFYPGSYYKKSVEMVKGESPAEEPDQPSWQTEVDPYGNSGIIAVPYPDPNPFPLPANMRAIWTYRVFVDYYESDWSKRSSFGSTIKLKRHFRESHEIQMITSETRFEAVSGQD